MPRGWTPDGRRLARVVVLHDAFIDLELRVKQPKCDTPVEMRMPASAALQP